MAINWKSIGSTFSGLTTALSSAGVSASSMPFILQQVGLATNSNPNQSAEMTICSQILQFSSNPAMVDKLAMTLASEQGIPMDAATLALTLGQPGVDITARIIQIETLIRNGG